MLGSESSCGREPAKLRENKVGALQRKIEVSQEREGEHGGGD